MTVRGSTYYDIYESSVPFDDDFVVSDTNYNPGPVHSITSRPVTVSKHIEELQKEFTFLFNLFPKKNFFLNIV